SCLIVQLRRVGDFVEFGTWSLDVSILMSPIRIKRRCVEVQIRVESLRVCRYRCQDSPFHLRPQASALEGGWSRQSGNVSQRGSDINQPGRRIHATTWQCSTGNVDNQGNLRRTTV